MYRFSFKKQKWILIIGFLYAFSRLFGLTNLPVFADEAIYIRWAQMIGNEPEKYFFLPMYDGKPPLQMWLLNGFLWLNRSDSLWSARFMSVLVSGFTLIFISRIVKELNGGYRAQMISSLVYILMPFTWFHDRMALIDPLYVCFLSLTFWGLLKLKNQASWLWVGVTGLGYGLAFLSKTPALFFGLIFPSFLILFPPQSGRWSGQARKIWLMTALAGVFGVAIFYSLKVSELFPFLFNRSGDFGYSIGEIITRGKDFIGHNLWTMIRILGWYGALISIIAGVIFSALNPKNPRSGTLVKLGLLGLVYASPFVIMGKIVYSRYYLPLIIFLIPLGSLALEGLWQKKSGEKLVASLIFMSVGVYAIWFTLPFYRADFNQVNLPKEDKEQYLTEWSAGFGNREVRDYLANQAAGRGRKVIAATEGFFGTLPDGLLMYFDQSDLVKEGLIEVYGIGQPISGIPDSVRQKAHEGQVYLVVNRNRLTMDYQKCCSLIAEYPRPQGGEPLWLLKYEELK